MVLLKRDDSMRGQSDDSYEDGGFAAPKTTTVARMATGGGGLETQSAGPYRVSSLGFRDSRE